MWILILIAVILLLVFYFRYFKNPTISTLTMITGGVKVGKTLLSVKCAVREYKKRLWIYRFKRYVVRFFLPKKFKDLEKPVIYSNIPLKCPYVMIDKDLLLRRKRFIYGSVIYINEASLVADSFSIRDQRFNDSLKYFNKLIGHETKGGILIYDTQNILDVHYNIKRSASQYIYIIKNTKLLFHHVLTYKYLSGQDDVLNVNIGNTDNKDEVYHCLVSKKYYKYYDRYSYSILTDSLPVKNDLIIHTDSLKSAVVLTFDDDTKKYKNKEVGLNANITNNNSSNLIT